MIVIDSVEIQAPPSKVFDWFMHLTENYCDWHPDHIKAEWIKGKPFEIGSILYAEEYLHGEKHKIKFKLTEIVENHLIEFRNLFPISLLSPRGSFIIEPKGVNTLFTATLTFRAGKLLTKIAKKQTELFVKHMEEEGKNLRNILEKKT